MTTLTTSVRLLCVAIYLSHYLISHHILPHYTKSNVFPFFDWNLFAYNSLYHKFYFLKIKSIDGNVLAEPKLVSHNRKLFSGNEPFLVPHQTLRVGEIYESSGKSKEYNKAIRELEQNLFSNFNQVEYEVFSSKVNLRKMIKYKLPEEEKHLFNRIYKKEANQ